jgi:hypothetical protein
LVNARHAFRATSGIHRITVNQQHNPTANPRKNWLSSERVLRSRAVLV